MLLDLSMNLNLIWDKIPWYTEVDLIVGENFHSIRKIDGEESGGLDQKLIKSTTPS